MNSGRRAFVRDTSTCLAHIFTMAAFSPRSARRVFAAPSGPVVAQEPWGRLERLASGIWALISTPVEDRTTLCNGGIVQGRSATLVIEAFARPEGATWLAQQARTLTGRWPDIAILTHFHGDHTGGLAGYVNDDATPEIRATQQTRDLVQQQDGRRPDASDPVRSGLLDGLTILSPAAPTRIDLGDRVVDVVPRTGHTASDLTIEIEEPSIVFCGDLVWNRMFPNYVDATPSLLSTSVRALVRDRTTACVPGHGPLADRADLRNYIALLDDVEAAARRAHERGDDAATAATSYRIPESLGEWTLFSPRYFETALGAWLRELRG